MGMARTFPNTPAHAGKIHGSLVTNWARDELTPRMDKATKKPYPKPNLPKPGQTASSEGNGVGKLAKASGQIESVSPWVRLAKPLTHWRNHKRR